VSAVLANKVLPNAFGVTVKPQGPVSTMHVGGAVNAAGGTLVYNRRNSTVTGQGVDPTTGARVTVTHQGPIHDPTAIMFVRTADLDATGKLLPTAPVEPLVLRALAGECVTVVLTNTLPADNKFTSQVPDLATYTTLQGVVKRDRFNPEGATRFDNNLIRASAFAGLRPQLVTYDASRHDGTVVGQNAEGGQMAVPGQTATYTWYMGDVGGTPFNGNVTLVATPIEFGGVNLIPADKVKQGGKGMVGSLVVQPAGSTFAETTQVVDRQDGAGTRLTRAQATVTTGAGSFRDFSAMMSKGLMQYYRDGTPVEHINGEGVGIPEDSQESTNMAINYGTEPMWFRFGILPQAPFGPATVAGSYAAVPNSHQAYSNTLLGTVTCDANNNCTGDPETPVFQANAGQEARIHITVPHGTTRGSTFALHGHVWQRDPYVCPGEARNGLTGACNMTSVGSRAIGENPLGFAQGGQESWNAATHFDVRLPSAGGGNAVAGDYLFRDGASFGNAAGVWGIMRVK